MKKTFSLHIRILLRSLIVKEVCYALHLFIITIVDETIVAV